MSEIPHYVIPLLNFILKGLWEELNSTSVDLLVDARFIINVQHE